MPWKDFFSNVSLYPTCNSRWHNLGFLLTIFKIILLSILPNFCDLQLLGRLSSARVRKTRYWGETLLSPIHCCDVTKPPYLLSGELSTSPLHSNRLYVYTVCCRRGGQCFSVLRTRHTDVVGDSSGRSYVTEQGHNVPLLRTRGLVYCC